MLSWNGKCCRWKDFCSTPSDHFGPITAVNDPVRNTGVLVGECWDLRMDYRQWGIHYPHVSGIAGQAKYGAQSVVLSGGYEDDEDHGQWFLYTGSGQRVIVEEKNDDKDQGRQSVVTVQGLTSSGYLLAVGDDNQMCELHPDGNRIVLRQGRMSTLVEIVLLPKLCPGTYVEGIKEEVVLSPGHALSFLAAGEGNNI